ncbi:hypothetical protein PR002_g29050 [Phytophthora rubi]|uniref:Uncharacterized protein n=1 Tax=Phytophthora rubi TaxID=129364 RepID=A0A6A3H515_9STRA|nr:hypothetical protein PR002_g29050 [Phytophthora rubi]
MRDSWMPSPSEIRSRYGNTTPVSRHELNSCNAIVDDDGAKDLDFDPATDQRREYYIGLFHELRFYGNKKHSRRSKVASGRHSAKAGARSLKTSTATRLVTVSESALRVSATSASRSGPRFCGCTKVQSRRGFRAQCRLALRARSANPGHVPVELKTLREKLITQLSSESAEGERNTQSRAVGDYSSRSSFTPFGGAGGGGIRTPSPFPERRSSGRSAAPTYRGQESILTNEYENEPDLGSGSDDQRFAGQYSEFPHVRLATGAAAAGRRHGPSPPEVWDRLEAVERILTAELAEIRQELKLLKARIGQAGQTASNIQVNLGTDVVHLRDRVSALEARIAPSHRE